MTNKQGQFQFQAEQLNFRGPAHNLQNGSLAGQELTLAWRYTFPPAITYVGIIAVHSCIKLKKQTILADIWSRGWMV